MVGHVSKRISSPLAVAALKLIYSCAIREHVVMVFLLKSGTRGVFVVLARACAPPALPQLRPMLPRPPVVVVGAVPWRRVLLLLLLLLVVRVVVLQQGRLPAQCPLAAVARAAEARRSEVRLQGRRQGERLCFEFPRSERMRLMPLLVVASRTARRLARHLARRRPCDGHSCAGACRQEAQALEGRHILQGGEGAHAQVQRVDASLRESTGPGIIEHMREGVRVKFRSE